MCYRKIRKQQLVFITIVFIFLCTIIYKTELSSDLYFILGSEEDVSCYYSRNSDSLPQIEQFTLKTNSIYFHETSCRGGIDSKQACSIESAARSHPNWDVYVLFSGPVNKIEIKDVNFELLRSYGNVKFLRVHLEEYCAGTPVDKLVKNGALNRTIWPQKHTRDVLKLVSLYKFGGIYLDLDTLVVKYLGDLPRNWAVKQDGYISTSALAFGTDYDTGVRVSNAILKILAETYRGDVLDQNGPILVTRVMKKICSTNNLENMTPEKCHGFNILSQDVLKTLYTEDIEATLLDIKQKGENEETMNINDMDPYIYAFPENDNNDLQLDPLYVKLAKTNCPVIYENYRNYFGT